MGDWYVNRIVLDRQPFLLLVSSASRLAILDPARDVKNLPARIGYLVAERLTRLGIDSEVIRAELGAMQPVQVAATRDRSITGQMVDFAKSIPYYLPWGWDESSLHMVEERLAQTPCLCGRSSAPIWPEQAARQLLESRWSSR